MAVIGNSATQQAFTPAVDFFSGNASTTAFTLSKPVASVAQVQAVIENVPQNPGSAYTVSGNTITFTSAPPSGTNNIYVYYTSPITQVIQPSQGTVGNTQMTSGAALANIGSGGITSTYLASGVALANIGSGGVTQTYLATGVAGSGPAFSASSSANTSASNATWTKLQLNTEAFDTANCFDPTTNYRFTPTVAGYYQVNGQVLTPSNANLSQVGIYKNGSVYAFTTFYHATTGVTNCFPVSTLVYLNGSTDYIELWGWQQGGTVLTAGAVMNASLARSA